MAAAASPRRRWRRAALVTALLIAAAVVTTDPVARWAANRWGDGFAGRCVRTSQLHVDLGEWPAVARAVTGSLVDVRATAEAVTIGPLTVRDLDARVGEVTLSPAAILTGDGGVSLRDGVARVRIATSDLDGYLHHRGIPARVVTDGTGLVVDAAGIRVPLLVRVERGALALALATPVLPALRVAVPGVSLLEVRVEPGAVLVTARFSGRPDALGCAVQQALG